MTRLLALALLAVAGLLDQVVALLRRVESRLRALRRPHPPVFATIEPLHDAIRATGCEIRSDTDVERAAARGRVHHPLRHPIIVTTIDELMPVTVEVDS